MIPTKTSFSLTWDATTGVGGTLFYTTLVAQTFVTKETKFMLNSLLPKSYGDVKVAAVSKGGETDTGIAIYTR